MLDGEIQSLVAEKGFGFIKAVSEAMLYPDRVADVELDGELGLFLFGRDHCPFASETSTGLIVDRRTLARNPVRFLRSDRNVGRRHGEPVRSELRFQWRQQSDIPEFTPGPVKTTRSALSNRSIASFSGELGFVKNDAQTHVSTNTQSSMRRALTRGNRIHRVREPPIVSSCRQNQLGQKPLAVAGVGTAAGTHARLDPRLLSRNQAE